MAHTLESITMNPKREFIDINIPRKSKWLDGHVNRRDNDGRPPMFAVLEFDLTGLCNRRCVFCPRSDPKVFPNIDRHMPSGLYEKIMRDIADADFDGTIVYSGFGEPLLYKDIETVIGLSRKYCPSAKIEILTNGDLLTADRLSGLFKAGITAICISMYDGPSQVNHFTELRKCAGLRDDQVILRKRWLGPEEHFGINLCNRGGTLNMEKIGGAPLKKPIKRSCYYPFCQTLIDYDGRVLLCTHDWGRKLIAGNVNDDSILDIWNNDILKKVKMHLIKEDRDFPPCDRCDVDGVLMGGGHFRKWIDYYDRTKKTD